MLQEMIAYFNQHHLEYIQAVWEHIQLSTLALLMAIILGLPIGYMAYRCQWINLLSKGIIQSFRVIPSLGVLFILIPIIGVGEFPALIALVILGLPPILLNTVLGFQQVSLTIVETGIALGMTYMQLLKNVLGPLALPYILNGIKLALIEIIASATLAAYIGAGGLGKIIFTGLGLYRLDFLLVGGISVMILSCLSMIMFNLMIKGVLRHEK